MKIIIALIIVVFLVSCSSTSYLSEPGPHDRYFTLTDESMREVVMEMDFGNGSACDIFRSGFAVQESRKYRDAHKMIKKYTSCASQSVAEQLTYEVGFKKKATGASTRVLFKNLYFCQQLAKDFISTDELEVQACHPRTTGE